MRLHNTSPLGTTSANSPSPTIRTRIVVPCYNEESRLNVDAFTAFLVRTSDIGIVFVNDGSSDGTSTVLHNIAAQFPARISVLDQPVNQGKAEAVRVGLLRALDEGSLYVGYFDADLATPLDAALEFIELLDRDPSLQFIIGSRVALLGRSISRKASRHYIGRAFATVASLVLALPVYDTQCGAKLLRVSKTTPLLFDRPFGSKWIFDVELFARYLTTCGSRDGLFEVPLRRWEDIGGSRLKSSDFVRAVAEMSAIYREYGIRRDFDTFLRLASAPFLRYVGAGGIGTLLHYATLTVLVEAVGVKPAIATSVGSLVGAATNYLLNYHFTFASKLSHWIALPRFLAVAVLATALNGAGMWFATRTWHVHYILAQLGCTAAVVVVGYLFNRLWTFRTRETAAPASPKKQPAPGEKCRV